MVIDRRRWLNETKEIELSTGLRAKIRRVRVSTLLKLLDVGMQTSQAARILVEDCLVEPKMKIDDLLPQEFLELVDAITRFSELDKIAAFRPTPGSPAPTGSSGEGVPPETE